MFCPQWVRGGQEVAGQDTLIIMGTYETTFQTSLAVPESSCGADPEIVRCQLRHNTVEGKVTRSQGYVVCRGEYELCSGVLCVLIHV